MKTYSMHAFKRKYTLFLQYAGDFFFLLDYIQNILYDESIRLKLIDLKYHMPQIACKML